MHVRIPLIAVVFAVGSDVAQAQDIASWAVEMTRVTGSCLTSLIWSPMDMNQS